MYLPSHSVRRPLVLVLLLFIVSLAAPPGAAPQAAPGEAHVAIILGNAPAGIDEPTAMQTARCLKAYELYENGTVDKLLVTGGFTRGYISEARMMKIALVTYGVPPGDVIEDELASTTIENGVFAAKLFEERGWGKKAIVVSQAFHLPRAAGIFKKEGFETRDATAADAPKGLEDFGRVLDVKPEVAGASLPADAIIVYEPYDSLEPMPWPTPALARRLRAAAWLYHRKAAPSIVLYNDRYTRGPVNIAQMMKVALVSLGVPAESLRVIGRNEYRWLGQLAQAYGDKPALVVTAKGAEANLRPRWPGMPAAAGAGGAGAAKTPPAGATQPPGTPRPPVSMEPPAKWKWVYVE